MTKVGTRNSTNMRWPSNKTFRLQVKFIFSTPTFPCTYSQDEEKSEMNPDTDHHLCVKFESNFDFDPSFNFFKRKCMNFQGRWKKSQGEVSTSPQQHRAKFGQHYRINEVYRYPPTNQLNLHSQLVSHFLSFFSYHHTNITRDVNLWRVSRFTVACI